MDDQDAIVRFDGVAKHYPGAPKPALDTTSIAIRRGEFFSILGPSGSGKTTALRLIAGFERPDRGKILVGSIDVSDTPPFRRDVNTVFQSYALFPHMRVHENVAYPLRMAGVPRADRDRRVAEALERVALSDFAQHYPHQMSGGQRQRVALARAFVGRPKVLLLDEPLGALDLSLRQQMQHVLVALQRSLGITFVYVTHDQGEALSMSDRVAVISGGAIRQLGPPHEIYYEPKSAFIAQFIGKSNLLPIEISRQGGAHGASINGVPVVLPQATCTGAKRFGIRFESIDIVGDQAATSRSVRLPGTVSDILFLGNACEVKVRCGALDLIALIPARRQGLPAPGQTVFACFDPGDEVLLDD